MKEHDFVVRFCYPNLTPGGKLFAGHYYLCTKCDLEVGDPSRAESPICPGRRP